MDWKLFFFYLFLLIFFVGKLIFVNCYPTNNNKRNIDFEQKNQLNENVNKLNSRIIKKTILTSSDNNQLNLPNFLTQLGKLGVNFDLDVNSSDVERRNKPFIYCEHFDYNTCNSLNLSECVETIKCYADTNSNHLGCMANLLYSSIDGTDIVLDFKKGCWVQAPSELRECKKDNECIMDIRGTGVLGRSSRFCCCRTHNCNTKFSFLNEEIIQEDNNNDNEFTDLKEKEELLPNQTTNKNILSINFWIIIIIIILIIILLFFIIIFKYIFIKNNKSFNKKTKIVKRRLLFSSNSSKIILKNKKKRKRTTSTTNPLLLKISLDDENNENKNIEINEIIILLNEKRIKPSELNLIEKISEGRFSQVYKAKTSSDYSDEFIIAVKQFIDGNGGEDSWINEMDIYSIKSISSNEFIANFLGGFHWNKRCWLLIEYYDNGSLFDFLKENNILLINSIKMIATMLNGLAFLHEEVSFGSNAKPTIVHRDIKSKNILVRNDLSSCITDFGLALKCDSSDKNGGISVEQNILQVGTRRYMSPEVLEGATEFTSFAFQQIDVYAAALVIWEILSRTFILNKEEEFLKENNNNEEFKINKEEKENSVFLLPYEEEIGNNPTIGQIRDLVVNQKFRPKIKQFLLNNLICSKIVKTMKEMWDHEPDGRITSACARDRSIFWLSEIT